MKEVLRINRRQFTATGAFLIVPRHVLGGKGQAPAPSDRIHLGCIGMGRQGLAVMMGLLPRPDIQVVAVCDCNQEGKDYAEYGSNALLQAARRVLGQGYESWGEDLTSPGTVNMTHTFRSSLGMGGREPARRLVESYYEKRQASGRYHGCQAYRDYRELLEKEKDIDAVYVATPDHWHAPISIAAMRKGKHVLCQKPMTHSVGEARRMAAVARETKVATSVTVNNPTSEASQLIARWLADGAIGRVRTIHNWSSRPFWPQGTERPQESPAIPPGLDWDLWLGPAPERAFHPIYHPFRWRGWYDFGCGSFGDMGCYSFAGLFKILDLTPPLAVEASSSEAHEETYPLASLVHLDFPDHEKRKALRLSWYDGGLIPPRPAGLKEEDKTLFQPRGEGVMYMGDKGMLLAGFNGQNPRVYPESKKYSPPPKKPRTGEPRDSAIEEWIAACKGGPEPQASFIRQSPATEALLLGCLAQRLAGERLEWDSARMRITNSVKANAFIDPPYRIPWV